LKIKRYLDCNW